MNSMLQINFSTVLIKKLNYYVYVSVPMIRYLDKMIYPFYTFFQTINEIASVLHGGFLSA